jgi:hypothetical protein
MEKSQSYNHIENQYLRDMSVVFAGRNNDKNNRESIITAFCHFSMKKICF